MKQGNTGAFTAIPTREEVFAAAASMPGQPPRWKGEEGPRWRLTFSPGSVQIGTKDYGRLNRSAEARIARVLRDDVTMLLDAPVVVPKRDKISEWSAKSRTNMVRTFCAVDWTPFVDKVAAGAAPALVTLTLPGDWLTVAPDGEAFKRLVNKFRARYAYGWGEPIAGAWKLEFQRRGAPHLHILTVPPVGVDKKLELPFSQWLSAVWADIVAHPDPEERRKHLVAGTGVDYEETLRYGDPKRISVYFSKHGLFAEKEYQNVVPDAWREPGKGPGRFWGVWVLDVLKANVEIADNAQYAVARHLRKVADRGSYSRAVRDVPGWTDQRTGEIHSPRARKRKVARRVRRMQGSRGFLSVNSGPAAAVDIARVISNFIRNTDFFAPAPDHHPRSALALRSDFYGAYSPESDEFSGSKLYQTARGLRTSWLVRNPLGPVGPGGERELDVFGHGGTFVEFLGDDEFIADNFDANWAWR